MRNLNVWVAEHNGEVWNFESLPQEVKNASMSIMTMTTKSIAFIMHEVDFEGFVGFVGFNFKIFPFHFVLSTYKSTFAYFHGRLETFAEGTFYLCFANDLFPTSRWAKVLVQ